MNRLVTRIQACLLVLASVLLVSCSGEGGTPVVDLDDSVQQPEAMQQASQRTTLLFGFDLRNSPQEDARQYLPFLGYLGRATGHEFELRFTPQGQRLADLLGQGRVDIAAVGAVSYIRAHEKYGARILVRGLNREGRADYQSCIVVAPDSAVHRLAELRGRTFAFGAMSSTQGHLIPRLMLAKIHIRLADLQGHQYTGSHQRCAEAVISGRFTACGMQDTLARRLSKEGLLRILQCSRPYPSSGIAIAPDIPLELAGKIRKALLDFNPTGKHAAGLYHWERTEMPNGFTTARDGDYDELRQAMIQFGMLSPARETP